MDVMYARTFLLVLPALVLVLLSSGCTVPGLGIEIPGIPDIPGFGGPTVVQAEDDVVVIRVLDAYPTEIDSGQTTRITAYVENKGDKKVDVIIELYDYCDGLFEIEGANSICPGNKWVHDTASLAGSPDYIPGRYENSDEMSTFPRMSFDGEADCEVHCRGNGYTHFLSERFESRDKCKEAVSKALPAGTEGRFSFSQSNGCCCYRVTTKTATPLPEPRKPPPVETSLATYKKCQIKQILPGQVVPVTWVLRAGDVDLRTVCPSDGIKVSATYKYTTNSLTTISFITQNELERSLEERSFKPVESYVSLGQGPIKPVITVEDKQPVPVFSGAKTVLQLKLKNTGSGSIASGIIDNEKVTFEGLSPPDTQSENTLIADDKNCRFVNYKEFRQSTSASGKGEWKHELNTDVKLIGKESSPYLCEIDISKLDGKFEKTTSRHVGCTVNYDYIVTKAVTVTVKPRVAV